MFTGTSTTKAVSLRGKSAAAESHHDVVEKASKARFKRAREREELLSATAVQVRGATSATAVAVVAPRGFVSRLPHAADGGPLLLTSQKAFRRWRLRKGVAVVERGTVAGVTGVASASACFLATARVFCVPLWPQRFIFP
jgi:hypothetical protein